MHSASFNSEVSGKDPGGVLVSIATLITEGRIPCKPKSKGSGFFESPHCVLNSDHQCDLTNTLCASLQITRNKVLELWKKNIPVCIEVLLTCSCKADNALYSFDDCLLVEKWCFSINQRRNAEPLFFNFVQLMSAIRSQLYFSQLTAWLSLQDKMDQRKIDPQNIKYRLTIPEESYDSSHFSSVSLKHDFPLTDIGNGHTVSVSCSSLPRTSEQPHLKCQNCVPMSTLSQNNHSEAQVLFDDRMHTVCTLKGKHRCEDLEDLENCNKTGSNKFVNSKKFRNVSTEPSTSSKCRFGETFSNVYFCCDQNMTTKGLFINHKKDLKVTEDKGKLLLDAIERSGLKSTNGDVAGCDKGSCDEFVRLPNGCAGKNESDNASCDMCESDICSIKDKHKPLNACDSPIPSIQNDDSIRHKRTARKKLTFGDKPLTNLESTHNHADIPTAKEQAKFRKNLDNAATMVFHSRTGLPLTSSPAPVRRGKTCFDFDSSINSVSAIKSALFPASFSTDDDSESDGSIASPCSPEINALPKRDLVPVKYRRKGHAANLLGSFEESVLNGRLEPVSTVHGFTAELGASGSFVPKHVVVPVTVFFYTLGDNDKVSSPYLGHINLGKKGYNVPRSGTVQVTLFNPLGTVVKMFVIMYDLSDMPNNSQTFIRQRTLYMPMNCKDKNVEWGTKWLRYLIHLRFFSSKSGKIYLHSDIRMIIFRKSDMDTATAHGMDMSYELRSFTHMPENPKFSPRK